MADPTDQVTLGYLLFYLTKRRVSLYKARQVEELFFPGSMVKLHDPRGEVATAIRAGMRTLVLSDLILDRFPSFLF